MSNRNGLAVFALLIGLGGLGLGLYSVFILPNTIIAQTTNNSEIKQIWTAEQSAVYYTTGSYADVPDMDLTITVNTGENVLILFNGQFLGTTGLLLGEIRFTIDNVVIPNSVRLFNIETTGGILMGNSISAQILVDNLAAGTYEIELQALGIGVSDRLDDGLLVIYTYI